MDFSGMIKMGIRVGLVAAAFAIIIVLLSTIQIPTPDYTLVSQGLNTAVGLFKYFLPGSAQLFNVAVAGFGLAITTWGLKFALTSIRMLFKVNQG